MIAKRRASARLDGGHEETGWGFCDLEGGMSSSTQSPQVCWSLSAHCYPLCICWGDLGMGDRQRTRPSDILEGDMFLLPGIVYLWLILRLSF